MLSKIAISLLMKANAFQLLGKVVQEICNCYVNDELIQENKKTKFLEVLISKKNLLKLSEVELSK